MGEIIENGPAALSPTALRLLEQAKSRARPRPRIAPPARPRPVRRESPTRGLALAASVSAATFIANARREASLRRSGRISGRPTPSYVQAGNMVELVDMNDPEVASVLNWDRPSDLDYSEDMVL